MGSHSYVEFTMPGLRGLVSNFRAAVSDPRMWWLARQSVVRYGAIQHVDELTEFMRMLRSRSLCAVLEIGGAQGGLFWLFCRVSSPDATLISVDLPPEHRHSGGLRVSTDLESMKQHGQSVHAILGNSHDRQTLERVRGLLGARMLDLLFIDGDHTYGGVRQDYEMYGSLVRPGGVIAFHDITQTNWPECQVDRFWADLANDASLRPMAIFSRVPSQFGGIGIIESR
jgi:predicted O-methyltransferase YrrM